MNLNLKGIRITRCEFHNEMGPNTKLNLQVNVNNQIKLPKDMSAESVGTVITKVMVDLLRILCTVSGTGQQLCRYRRSKGGDSGYGKYDEPLQNHLCTDGYEGAGRDH